MPGKTKTISVHRVRRVARARERDIQRALDLNGGPEVVRRLGMQTGYTVAAEWPAWAKGVRVERVGFFEQAPTDGRRRLGVQFAVVATERRGH